MGKGQVTEQERERIFLGLSQGISQREIGRRLGRHHSVVARELKRNRGPDGSYRPFPAQQQAMARIRHFQTDNGSEFEDHFRTALQKKQSLRKQGYPRHPQANAHGERFNRTLREQFVRWHDHLVEDLSLFNQYLLQYLLWYNTEKPHQTKNKLPPLKYFIT
jgi:IS30 family transposase